MAFTPLVSSQTVTDETVSSGTQNIVNGGIANSTTINNGGYQNISSGGWADSAIVNSGGSQRVSSGGTASLAIINSSGVQIVYSGGVDSLTTINSSGLQIVSSGGVDSLTTINSSGMQIVSSGGTASLTTINSGGQQRVSSGGVASLTTINSGGQQRVSAGGTANSNIINSGGQQIVYSGGVTNSTYIDYSGSQYVSSGGRANSTTINDGCQYVSSGGVASAATISSGGWQWVSSGGAASSTTINSGGYMVVSSGGIVSGSLTVAGGHAVLDTAASFSSLTTLSYVLTTADTDDMLVTVNGGTLGAGVTAYSLNLDNTAAGSYILAYGVNLSGMSSKTFSVTDNGQNVNVQVGSSYTFADGDTLSLTFTDSFYDQLTAVFNVPTFTPIVSSQTVTNETVVFGIQSIIKNGIANNTTINSGGEQDVSSGGAANFTTINQGAQFVSSGGVASNTTINSGGWQGVLSGGAASNTTINSGGLAIIMSGTVNGINQQAGGAILADTSATITAGTNTRTDGHSAFSIVSGVARNFLLENGGELDVLSGHSAIDTIIASGGQQIVYSGGVTSNAIVNSGGWENISSGGIVSGMLTIAGGDVSLDDAASVSGLATISYVLAAANTDKALVTVNGGTLGAGITIYSLNLDNTAAGSYILADGVDLTGMNGKTFSVTDNGQNVNVQVGASYTFADGDKLSLNFTDSTRDQLTATLTAGGAVPAFTPLVSSQTVTGETVGSGTQSIIDSGIANSTTISDSGYQNISSGGVTNSTVINSGGEQNVSSGGGANSTTINSGGCQYVFSGGAASDTILNYYGEQDVFSGGTASNTTINSGGRQGVWSGGTASNTTINSSGAAVITGGTVNGINQQSGGAIRADTSATITAGTNTRTDGHSAFSIVGGIASNFLLENGGELDVLSGHTAIDTIIASGGQQIVYSGGVTSNAIVNSGGWENISSGGIVSGMLTIAGGDVSLDDAASVSGLATISYVLAAANTDKALVTVNGGTLGAGITIYSLNLDNTAAGSYILADGVDLTGMNGKTFSVTDNGQNVNVQVGASYTFADGDKLSLNFTDSTRDQLTATLTAGGAVPAFTPLVSSQTVTGETVGSGTQSIINSGIANSTTINSGGEQNVSSGGVTNFTVINSGGEQNVSSGGAANSTTINYYGYQVVSSGGVASDTILNYYGEQDVSSGGAANNTMVNSGGWQGVWSGGTANNTTINSSGAAVITGGTVNGINQQSGGAIRAGTDAIITGGTNTRTDGHSAFSIIGGIASNFLLENGGELDVLSGHTAIDTIIAYGGCQNVSSGGMTSNIIVNSGGDMNVNSGGIVSGTLTIAGGDVGLDDAASVSDLATISYVLAAANTDETLIFVSGGTLGVGVTAYSLNLDNAAAGTYILADGADLSGMDGKTFSVTANGQNVNVQVGSSYVFSDKHVLSLNLTDDTTDQLTATFILDTTPPSTPAGLNQTITGSSVAFDWNDSTDELNGSGVKQYEIQVDNNSNFSSAEYSASSTVNSATVNSLADGAYYWEVRAQDNAGNYSAWITGSSFVVDATAPSVPSALTQIVSGKNVALDWNDSTDNAGGSGVKQYQVQIDDDSDFSSPASTQTITASAATANGLSDGNYYWQVRAQDNYNNWSAWSSVSSFVVDTTAPGAPAALTQTVTGNNVALDWADSSDATSGVKNYLLQYAVNDQFTGAVQRTVSTSDANVFGLSDGIYYWRIQAVDNSGNAGAWSAGSFTVDATAPSVPINLTQTAAGKNVVLDWDDASDATSGVKQYQVQIDYNSYFNSPVSTQTSTVSAAAANGLAEGNYYWRVRTQDNSGNYSAWSSVSSFIVDSIAPSVPSALTQTVTGKNVAFDWSDSSDSGSGLKNYLMEYALNGQFTGAVQRSTTVSNANISSLAEGVYSWRVQAVDNSGNAGNWITGDNFTVDTVKPTVPDGLTKTLNGKNVTLDWNDATDAIGGIKQYEVEIGSDSKLFSLEYFKRVTTSQVSVETLTGGTYYWRVRTQDNSGNYSAWSVAANFIMELTPPTVPGGLKQTVTGNSAAFNWTASTDAGGVKQYQVQVDNNSNFSSPEYAVTPTANAAAINSLAVGTYYWEVRSQDNGGNWSAWSKSSSFMVTPVDTAANTWQTAKDIGAGVDNWVGFGDAADVYKLTMANGGTLTLGLTGLSGNADLSLLSSTGAVLKSSANAGTAGESIAQNLLAGTYYVKVAPGKVVTAAAYTLTNQSNYFPTDTAANDYKTAKDIGAGVDNWVGFGDAADVYKLTMTNAGSLTLGLTGLSGNANLSLLSSTGAVLKSSASAGIANESIAQNLLAGTYYVKVAAGAGVTAAAYTLTDQISYYSGDTLDKAGNTIAAAKLVDASLPTQTGWVGFGDSDDYYRFEVATATQGTLRLNMTGGNADLSLYDKNGRLLQKSAHTGTLEDVITGNLAVGTYYARVNAVSGNNSIDYTLEFSKKNTAGMLAG